MSGTQNNYNVCHAISLLVVIATVNLMKECAASFIKC